MTRVLFIILSYSMGGGAESLLTTIVNHLDPEKYRCDILEMLHADVKEEPCSPNVTVLPYIMRADDPERKTKMYSFYHEWDKVIGRYVPEDYDVYVSFNYQRPSFLLPPGGRNIAWIHSDLYVLGRPNKAEERELQRRAFAKTSRIVAISDVTYASVRDLFPESLGKTVQIFNGVDIENVRRLSHESCLLEPEHPALLYCGRLEERKRPCYAVDVLAELRHRGVPAHLYFMGYGPLENNARDYVRKLGLEDAVRFLGYMGNPFPVMGRMDLTVMTSATEGFPMNLLESVALGVPFVSTPVGGAVPLSCGGSCGRVEDSIPAFADAVERLLGPDREEARVACRKGIEAFALDGYIARIEALIDDVARGD